MGKTSDTPGLARDCHPAGRILGDCVLGSILLAQVIHTARRSGGLLAALFPCRESALLTGLMCCVTTLMLFVQFPDNRELMFVNMAGYAVLCLLNRPCGHISLALSMLFTGIWFVLVTALPLLLMPES